MSTVHVFISGFVQGVGYRAFVKKHAVRLGLTGWVKNLPDGRVEAIMQGDQAIVEQLIELCKKGPFMSEVANVEVFIEDSAKRFSDFSVVRD